MTIVVPVWRMDWVLRVPVLYESMPLIRAVYARLYIRMCTGNMLLLLLLRHRRFGRKNKETREEDTFE